MGVSMYSVEFKDEAVKQVTEKRRPVAEVAKRLGVMAWSLCTWMRAAGVSTPSERKVRPAPQDQAKENAALKAQIQRLEEERDILKISRAHTWAAFFAKESR